MSISSSMLKWFEPTLFIFFEQQLFSCEGYALGHFPCYMLYRVKMSYIE